MEGYRSTFDCVGASLIPSFLHGYFSLILKTRLGAMMSFTKVCTISTVKYIVFLCTALKVYSNLFNFYIFCEITDHSTSCMVKAELKVKVLKNY